MLFNSWEFLILLLATLGLYYLPFAAKSRRVWQVTLLLAASAIFYAWNEPRLLVLLSSSCVLNAIAVERILYWKSATPSDTPRNAPSGLNFPQARRWLVGTVVANLACLAFFKYAGFLAELLPAVAISTTVRSWLTEIPLPVGISFYTFQGISLVVDTWRRDISPHTEKQFSARGRDRLGSIRDTSFYISFFPQLVAGPIVKAHEFVDQIGSKRFGEVDWLTVRRSLITGYFLKVVVADNLAEQTASLSLGAEVLAGSGPIQLMALLYSYSLQIFADFAGYSLIAIGLGALFGYRLPPNFNFPYLSTSISEFWRRWHLSLSSWLRDYLYIPLGGNRKGAGRTYVNLFLVMFLGGLWHGAAWKFALWGSLHGLFLMAERRFRRRRSFTSPQSGSRELQPRRKSAVVLAWLITFHAVTFLWLTFQMPNVASISAFFRGLTSGNLAFSGPPPFALVFYGTAVVLYHGWGWLREHRSELAARLARSRLEPILHALMTFLIITNPGAPRGFIYFQF